MVIHPSGTFSYSGKVTEDSFEGDEIVVQARSTDTTKETRLLGHTPKIRFWNKRLIVDASSRTHAQLATASYPIGDVIERVVQTEDTLTVHRMNTGDLVLAVFRNEELLLALGAASNVLFTAGIEVGGGAIQSPIHAEISEDFVTCNWIEFEADEQTVRLRERESAELAGYYIYVESVWKDGEPGEAECLAVTSLEDETIRNAAMRSAILLGASKEWRGGTQVQLLDW